MASLSIKNLIQRLQNVYLPELLSLHGDCQWLISKVSCGEKKELQSNEARLVQFVAIVEGIIKQIRSYSTTINYDPSTEYSLVDLETKISKAVLPVKAKLIERVQQQLQQQQTQTSIPFQQTVQSNKKQLQPTRQNSSTLNTKQPSTSRNQSQTHIQKKEVPKATNNQTAKVSDDDVKRRASDSLSDSTTSTDRDSFSPRNTGSAISNRVGNHPQTKDLNNKAVTASSVQQAQKSFVTSAAVKAKLSAGKRGTTTLSADDLIFSNNNNNCSDIEAILASNISNLAKPPTTRPLNLLPISMLKPKLASVNGAVSIQQDSLAAKSPRASSINESNYPTEVVRQINRSSELVVRQISGDATQCITGTNIANTDNADNLKAANGAPKLPPPKKCSPLTAALLGAHLKPSKSVQSMPTVTLPTTVLLVDEMDRYLTPNELTDSTTQLSTAINKGCDVGTLFNQWITSNDENQPLCTTKIDGLIDVNVASSPWLDFGQSPLSRSRSNSNLNEDFDIGLGIGSDDHLVDGLAVHNFNNAMDDDHKLFTMDAFVDNNMDGMSGHTDTSSDSKSSCNASNSGNNDFYTSKNLTFSVSNSTMEEETNIIVAALTKRPSFNQNIFDDGCGGEFDVDHFIRNGDHTNPNTGDTNDINNILNDSANVSEMFPFNLASGAKVIQDEGLSDPSILLEYGNVMDNPQTSLESLQVEGKKRLYSDTLHKESVHNMDALVNMAESQLQDSAASKSVGSSIFDSMRKQFCIKSEIYNVLQPLSVSITHNNSNSGFAPSPKLTLKKSLSIIGSIKPLSTTDGDVQYYKSAMDIDLSSAVGMDGSIKESYCDEYMTSRRRRRLNQIVPNPRKPRQADYTCSLCSEGYRCNVNDNPWWAVYMHECPRCKQIQIPRIDINASSNAIELDPNNIALYGEGIEDSGDDVEGEDCYTDDEESNDCGGGVNDDQMDSIRNNNSEVAHNGGKEFNNDTNSGDGVVSGAVDGGEEEEEEKPFDGEGTLQKEEASKLLVLMCHARTCTGSHASAKHADICKSTKFLMLHIRDCKGVDIHGRDCQLPW
eukprot:CAMPEP_0170066004 /NCGR_PEP_ID=MMETSP0019_2-20121128/5861_1 /TAXON_ID=98059 /ORGANISM="Dinobryon sp., Strain UTEXLB2267" /LENGTH=1056 /DNA_ID=CAMNT_0010272979 /DNA_START=145 /DNA_END=3312 /DNA_ORIENTATION=-